ncbi:hypothetical protein [Streptomyces jumonjinensis]|uniref:hypothetical protein n=1 Tax=Streptomyces jumonjinensis TaxID=1945 RepID=UPI001296150E|nr:hypothetical protein [Streptomyces jumonjinensis]
MIRFMLGIILGALSGSITYGLTGDTDLACIIAGIAMVLGWLGMATLLIADD